MSTFNSQTNPIGAANIISGERTVAQVTFPLTGDPETDLISGVNALIAQLLPHSPGCTARALSYLAKRFQDQNDYLERFEKFGQAVAPNPLYVPAGTGTIGGACISPGSIAPAATPNPPSSIQGEIDEFQRLMRQITGEPSALAGP